MVVIGKQRIPKIVFWKDKLIFLRGCQHNIYSLSSSDPHATSIKHSHVKHSYDLSFTSNLKVKSPITIIIQKNIFTCQFNVLLLWDFIFCNLKIKIICKFKWILNGL